MNNVNTISNVNECPVTYSEIKSPFAVYGGETLKNSSGEFVMPHFEPSELEQLILILTEKFLVVTSILLYEEMKELQVENITQIDIQRRLKKLANAGFLVKQMFSTPDGNHSATAVYKLGFRGIGYLKGLGRRARLQGYLAQSDATHIKRILSAVQFVVKHRIAPEDFEICPIVMVPQKNPETSADKIFRPQAMIRSEDRTVFVEAIRQNEAWKQEILDKLNRIAAVINSKKKNIPIQNPTLVLVAESTKHMQEVIKLVESEYVYSKIEIFYTADPIIYAQPESCLYQIKRNFWDTLLAM